MGQESGEWAKSEEDAEEEKLSVESYEWDEDSSMMRRAAMIRIVYT